MKKTEREIMEILEAYDLTGCAHSAAQLAGCDPKTVARYVGERERGRDPYAPVWRSSIIDTYLPKIEELVERSSGKIRADDVVHAKLKAMGFSGSERTTRRAVATAKGAFGEGKRRVYRLWIAEPGMWMQWDFADGPMAGERKSHLWCCWPGAATGWCFRCGTVLLRRS